VPNSVDDVQKILMDKIFSKSEASKKAAGRALGTIQEIIVWLLLDAHGLGNRTILEYRLPEYARPHITHNVEFSINPQRKVEQVRLESELHKTIKLPQSIIDRHSVQKTSLNRSVRVIDHNSQFQRPVRLINPSFVKNVEEWQADALYFGQYIDNNQGSVVSVSKMPVAFIESKRVGLEVGTTTGPQTIEKAKQGSYTALRCSKLQKVFLPKMTCGVIAKNVGEQIKLRPYDEVWEEIIASKDIELLNGIIRSVIFLSDHINWYVNGIAKKDLTILQQSYDWTIWINDQGLVNFVTDCILGNEEVFGAFSRNYTERTPGSLGFFTKNRIDDRVYRILLSYFNRNLQRILKDWLCVLGPSGKQFSDLVTELKVILSLVESK
jgi:hypothetical protein